MAPCASSSLADFLGLSTTSSKSIIPALVVPASAAVSPCCGTPRNALTQGNEPLCRRESACASRADLQPAALRRSLVVEGGKVTFQRGRASPGVPFGRLPESSAAAVSTLRVPKRALAPPNCRDGRRALLAPRPRRRAAPSNFRGDGAIGSSAAAGVQVAELTTMPAFVAVTSADCELGATTATKVWKIQP